MTRVVAQSVSTALIVALTLQGSLIAQANALAGNQRLRGIEGVAIRVINAGGQADEGQQCGLPDEAVRSIASKGILDARLKVLEDIIGPILVIELATMYFAPTDQCVTMAQLELSVFVEGRRVVVGGSPMVGSMSLMRRGGMVSTQKPNHYERARQRIQQAVEEITTAIRLQNQ